MASFFLLSLQKIITMKKLLFLAVSLMFMQLAIAQDWKAQLVSSTDKEIVVELNVNGFSTNNVTTPNGDAVVITSQKMMLMAQAGEPDVPSVVIPTVIGDNALMDIEIIDSQYVDYQNVDIAPSKGDFPRSINPEDVPYTYGAMYQQDAFYPAQMVRLDEPYIHRDVRGQNMVVTPYLYNAVTKTLRVYNHIVLRMKNVGVDDRNVFVNRLKSIDVDREFNKAYESRYINYEEAMAKYVSIADDGELLIICHDAFMTAMAPFVAWKKQIGRPTTMVGTSETGNTAAAIKAYIQTYYAENPNMTDILLVGDVAQIPGVYISAGSGWDSYSGYGDMQYGQLAGNDYYNEVNVGRFCCENEDQVTNHVLRVLNYERDLDETATWLTTGQGVSKNEGAGSGHYGEADYQHIDNIRNDLLAYNYTEIHRDYQGVAGVSSSAAIVSQHINDGVSIINYCNHGNITLWGVFSYSNSNVDALTNDYKLPYIISVACLNGKYDHSSSCFAEAWMRATNNSNGNPTGAIGGMFSYISQPWTPPQYGQDEMVDILVESYSDNIRRTMGGVSINGNMKVLDQGANQNPVKGTYNTWILFGDPTLTLRNAVPAVMNVTAASTMETTATSFAVNATNADGALATLTFNGEILGSATITNGSANITFQATGAPGTATLTVFGYNKKTYITTVEVTSGSVTPTAPTNLTATVVNDNDISLNWDATSPVTYYIVYLDNNEISSGITTNSFNLRDNEPGTYTFNVATYYNGITSPKSNAATVTVEEPGPVVCPGPKNYNGDYYYEDGQFGAKLAWDKADYEFTLDRFEVYRSLDGDNFEMVRRIVNTPSITHYECTDIVDNPGDYIYRIITFYQNECQSDPEDIQIIVTSVGEDSIKNVELYPNPTSGKVNIKAEAMKQITIVNVMGQVMMAQVVDNDEVVIDMSVYDNGMYLVNIITDNGNIVKILNVLR